MNSITNFLAEDANKNLHLEHIEDLILNDGSDGLYSSIRFLRSLSDMFSGHTSKPIINLTTKWDGAPAIFAGINPENKKFFVGTKGVFAKNAKLNYTNADIDKNHSGEGLNKKLKIALQYLPELGISGVMQGDMMFTQSDLKRETISGQKYITFQPNTLLYAIPDNTPLAQQVQSAKMGIVWHTEYYGPVLSTMRASFNINIGKLRNSRNVWYRDASFVDMSGTATFTESETKQINALLNSIETLANRIPTRLLNQISTMETYKIQIKSYNNTKVRAGEKINDTTAHTIGLIKWVEDKLNKNVLDAKKADTRQKRIKEKTTVILFYTNNKNWLKMIFDLQNMMVDAKTMFIRKLEKIQQVTGTFIKTDDGIKATTPEGFVAVDRIGGGAVKLVDRLTFSHQNFTAAKAWSK